MSEALKTAQPDIIMMDVDELLHADYNPRQVDEERLAEIKKSLSYLGFLTPIYRSKKTGTILSGHQRSTAAKRLGYKTVPVVNLNIPLDAEKGINLLFNKVTNDMNTFASGGEEEFYKYMENVGEATEGLTLRDVTQPHPTVGFEMVPTKSLLEHFVPFTDHSLKDAGKDMIANKIFMPIVICEGRIINGMGRYYGYMRHDYEMIPVVNIPVELEAYAKLALNCLSMDFNIQEHLADELRFNAFRRKSVDTQLTGLSRGWTYHMFGRMIGNSGARTMKLTGKQFDDYKYHPFASPEMAAKYKDFFGDLTIDMGAGSGRDVDIMRDAGINAVGFEPYFCPAHVSLPDLEQTRAYNTRYLEVLRDAKTSGVDTIVSSFVLNSIPHHKDRMAYVIIIAAMSRMKTKLILGTQNASVLGVRNTPLSSALNVKGVEANMVLGSNKRFFKAQKYFYDYELERLFSKVFVKVETKVDGNNIFVTASLPKRLPAKLILDALRHEFELPFEGGMRMGLSELAIECFSEYMGRDLLAEAGEK